MQNAVESGGAGTHLKVPSLSEVVEKFSKRIADRQDEAKRKGVRLSEAQVAVNTSDYKAIYFTRLLIQRLADQSVKI